MHSQCEKSHLLITTGLSLIRDNYNTNQQIRVLNEMRLKLDVLRGRLFTLIYVHKWGFYVFIVHGHVCLYRLMRVEGKICVKMRTFRAKTLKPTLVKWNCTWVSKWWNDSVFHGKHCNR